MSFLTRFAGAASGQGFLTPAAGAPPPAMGSSRRLQQRSLPDPDPEGSLADLINRLRGSREIPWRIPSTHEAMGVPAIFRAVTLVSNLIGSMAMRTFRDGLEMPAADRPRLVVRPDPFKTPREFYRQTAYSLARYGEFCWWVAARDVDDQPVSIVVVNPKEVTVTENENDLRQPKIEWRNRRMQNSDFRIVRMTGDVGDLRGSGPLQWCQAASSIAVEAQQWAANFYALGGYPSLAVRTTVEYDDNEINDFKEQWADTASNMLRVLDPTVGDIEELGKDVDKNQMLESRNWQNGDVARMFGIPGKLLEYAMQGSSLTYQNIGAVFDDFIRTTLGPDYLEPIEQEMSDLLPRSTTAEFNRAALLAPDAKTQADIAALLYEKGITDRPESRTIVGYEPDIENAPVPFSPPQAFAFQQRAGSELRCSSCGKLLMELVTPPYRRTCERCKTVNVAA